jgi:hypothetical protein
MVASSRGLAIFFVGNPSINIDIVGSLDIDGLFAGNQDIVGFLMSIFGHNLVDKATGERGK